MKYMLLIYADENAIGDNGREECYAESVQLTIQLDKAGQFIAASPLHATTMATSVRMRGGKRIITDGPFAETREQLGGYFLITADDLDQAISVAERVPAARWGTVEIRPVIEIQGLPIG